MALRDSKNVEDCETGGPATFPVCVTFPLHSSSAGFSQLRGRGHPQAWRGRTGRFVAAAKRSEKPDARGIPAGQRPMRGRRGGGGAQRRREHARLICVGRVRSANKEDSPSGLWRTPGTRVGFTPSGVQIPHPPQKRSTPCPRAHAPGEGFFVSAVRRLQTRAACAASPDTVRQQIRPIQSSYGAG